MSIVQLVCFQVECDSCETRLRDYGDYEASDSPSGAIGFAVNNARWRVTDDGRTICPSCEVAA